MKIYKKCDTVGGKKKEKHVKAEVQRFKVE
jgi:hypothetical protein